MSVDIKVYCDKCSERITQDRSMLQPKCGPLRTHEPFDLCSTCQADFLEWLGPIPGRKGETNPPTPKPIRTTTPLAVTLG